MVVLAFAINLLCSGCGTGMTVVAAMESPTISQVSPQVVTAGTPSVTVTVQGANFQSQAALTVNGTAVPTTVVNSTTLAANISGSPLAQPAVAQLQVKNTNGGASNQVPLTVTSAPDSQNSLSISTTQLASAQVGVSYKVSLAAAGGTQPYKWSVSSGSLPSGLTMSNGGVISGTPSVSGTFTFGVTVTDSSSKAQNKTVTFSIVVAPVKSAPTALSIGSGALSAGAVGVSYAVSLNVSGGTPGYTWSLASGKLPAGLALSSAGVISGTPTASGTSTFAVAVQDSGSPVQKASASESITVSAAPPGKLTITTTGLAAGKNGSSYSASLNASGGTPGYTWSIASGSLPAGLTLSSAGVISGTPTGSGTSTFTVGARDSGSPAQTASGGESITVNAAPSKLTITTTGLAAGKNGTSYSASLSASGGTPGYTWSIASGSLPAGLTLSSAGVISGTPTGSGTSTFTVGVQDSGSPAQTASVSESITVSAAPSTLTITSANLSAAQTGSSYTATLSATGGTPGYTWSVSAGKLPAGLSLSSGGVISGTPTKTGTSSFTVTVTDSASPAQTASATESITVGTTPTTLTITTTSLTAGKSGTSYSASLSATGGTPGYTWSIASGSLPAGLALSSAGQISGTPTASGTVTFTVAVQDSASPAQTASAQESITVSAASSTLTITSTSLGAAQTGNSYSTTLSATGGTPGYTWSVTAGSLPAGLSLSSAGVISGTPTATGSSSFTVTVTDSASPAQTASAQESISVTLPQLTITTTSLNYGTNGASYSASLAATGGAPSYTWSVASGSLPAGLSLSGAGVISGTPTGTGTSTFTVSVSDSESPAETATEPESITISANTSTPGSAQIYVYPQAAVAPRGSYQTVTAVVTGVNDKTVTWSTDGGTIVGTNPCVVNEPCTVALYTTSTGKYHLTATSNASHSVSASSTITITASPTPTTSHPRLGGITAAMLPALRAKAVSSNPLYMALLTNAVNAYNTDNQIWSWSCNGGSGQPNSDQTQTVKVWDAYLFAFMSMIDPSDSTYNWGCYGRDIWVYYAIYWQNPLGSSYSPSTLASRQNDLNNGLTGNNGADSNEPYSLTADWLMAGGYLSAADMAQTRGFFETAAQSVIAITYTGERAAVGGYNSAAQFDTNSIFDFDGQRAMGNNYTHSKMLYLVAAALTFNDTTTDDPPLANTCGATRYQVCPDGTAGSLHAYWTYFTGGMLYKDWAHMEDPGVTVPAYQAAYSNLSGQPTCEDSTNGDRVPCFGDGRGGESVEGSWYQYSMKRLEVAMLSIQSAGYNDPILYGPQMSLATSSWWDMKAVSDLEFLTYSYNTNFPMFSYFSTGDTLYLYRMPADFNAQAWMMVGDADLGRTDRTATLEWPLIFTSVGGVNDLLPYDLRNDFASANAIPMFLSFPAADPTTNPPADPRPSFPTDLYNGGNQKIMVRSGWDVNGTESASWGDGGKNTVFSYYCANSRIDHEHGTCGGFDVLSDGEYITKTRTVFNDYNMMLATAEHSNEAGYGDSSAGPCASESCFEWQAVLGSDGKGGGQLWHGLEAGSATVAHAELPAYVAAVVDTTGLYNGSSVQNWGSINGVAAASRSLVYLRGSNQIVYYDRGSGDPNSKRLWMTTTGPITIASSTVSWPTRSGKQLAYLTSLLPANAQISDAGAYMTAENGSSNTSDWEPYSHVLIDAGNPSSTQFLTVLEWGGSSFTKSNTVLVQSSAGQNFDGALVGGTLVMFMRNWPATFTSVTYPASGAATQYVSDLTPSTTYSISGAGAPATATTDTAGVLTFNAAGTGNITITPGH